MVVGDGDGKVIVQRTRVPVGRELVPDTIVSDADKPEGSRDDEKIGEPDTAIRVFERNHLCAW